MSDLDRNVLYDDGRIALDEGGLVIRWYYLWGGSKRIPYTAIRGVKTHPPAYGHEQGAAMAYLGIR